MIKDNHKATTIGGMKMPRLKGHVKLTLRNVRTGETEVFEGDNVITDAVRDIMATNFLGEVDFSKIWGSDGLWRKWFGGIICYNQAHESLSETDYFMPDSNSNAVIAHAGQTPIDTEHDDDSTRGAPSSISYIRTDKSLKLVWYWEPARGNGIIRALSLCHTDTGSYGNGVDSYHFRNSFNPWEEIQTLNLSAVSQNPRAAGNAFAQYDENHALFFFIGEDGWYQSGVAGLVPSGEDMINEVTVYVRRLPYTKAGLFDVMTGTDVASDTRKFTVETSIGFKYNPAWYFDPETKHLWLFTNFTYAVARDQDVQSPHTRAREWSRNTVWYTVIDCNPDVAAEDREVDSGEIVSNDDDLAFLECSADGSLGTRMYYGNRVIHQNILVDGDYVYLPMGDSVTTAGTGDATQNFTGFKKININDQTEQEAIPFCDYESETPTVMNKYYAAVKQGDLAAGFGWVMNGGMLYPCKKGVFDTTPSGWNVYDNIYMNEDNSPIVFATRRPTSEADTQYTLRSRYIFASKLLNTSKFNVEPAREKTMEKDMTVEYTIVEVSEDE